MFYMKSSTTLITVLPSSPPSSTYRQGTQKKMEKKILQYLHNQSIEWALCRILQTSVAMLNITVNFKNLSITPYIPFINLSKIPAKPTVKYNKRFVVFVDLLRKNFFFFTFQCIAPWLKFFLTPFNNKSFNGTNCLQFFFLKVTPCIP